MTKLSYQTKYYFNFFGILLGSIFVICFSLSCCDNSKSKTKPVIQTVTDNDGGKTFRIIEIDGCEYVAYSLGYAYGTLTHKGNCKYCTAKRDREMDTLRRYMYDLRYERSFISIDSLSKLMKNKIIIQTSDLSQSPLIIIRK